MLDDRSPDPISRLGTVRDRPLEASHFDRIEAARGGGHREAPRRRAPAPRPRPRPAAPPLAVAVERDDAGHTDEPRVGRHLDVLA